MTKNKLEILLKNKMTTTPADNFRPKILKGVALTTAVEDAERTNALLEERDHTLIARMYEKYRSRLAAVFNSQDFDDLDVFFWIDLIGDMMNLAKTYKVSGTEKKQILLSVLAIVIDNEIPEEKRGAAHAFVNTTISPSIDLAVYFMHQVAPKCRKFWQCKCC